MAAPVEAPVEEPVLPEKAEVAAPVEEPVPPEKEEASPERGWINLWGLAAVVAVALALLQAPLLGLRWLTVAFSALGVALVVLGIWDTRKERRSADWAWFSASGLLSGIVLLLALVVPGALSSWWDLDTAAHKPDPNKQVVLLRARPMEAGQPLAGDQWVDAAGEMIRQDDVVVRVESVKLGTVPGRGSDPDLLVRLRIANVGQQKIKVEGFGKESQPKLTDESGQAFAFQEQRLRKQARGAPVFEGPDGPSGAEVLPGRFQDVLLVFPAPPGAGPFRLEVPCSGWGRKGKCHFRIAELFEPAKGI